MNENKYKKNSKEKSPTQPVLVPVYPQKQVTNQYQPQPINKIDTKQYQMVQPIPNGKPKKMMVQVGPSVNIAQPVGQPVMVAQPVDTPQPVVVNPVPPKPVIMAQPVPSPQPVVYPVPPQPVIMAQPVATTQPVVVNPAPPQTIVITPAPPIRPKVETQILPNVVIYRHYEYDDDGCCLVF